MTQHCQECLTVDNTSYLIALNEVKIIKLNTFSYYSLLINKHRGRCVLIHEDANCKHDTSISPMLPGPD